METEVKIEIESVAINLSQLIIGHYSKLMEVNKFCSYEVDYRNDQVKVNKFNKFMKLSAGIFFLLKFSIPYPKNSAKTTKTKPQIFILNFEKRHSLSLMRF